MNYNSRISANSQCKETTSKDESCDDVDQIKPQSAPVISEEEKAEGKV
jgi:hypothetical protein